VQAGAARHGNELDDRRQVRRPGHVYTPGAVARFSFEPSRALGASPWCSSIGGGSTHGAVAEFAGGSAGGATSFNARQK
jgi:hypothetical protein